jgi:hypothetical protein
MANLKMIVNTKLHRMKSLYKISVAAILIAFIILPYQHALAGNKDRSGQAGATELLINPWAKTSGWGGAGSASVTGLEAMFGNVGGLARTKGFDVGLSYTRYLSMADINIYSFGFATSVGESGAMGLSIMNMNFGTIDRTTNALPDEGAGTYNPNLININLAYSRSFSNSIHGGFVLKIISESLSDASAQGLAIDAGIQYITGPNENIKLGVALKNIGAPLSFSGDGLSIKSFLPGQNNAFTTEWRAEQFELPAQLKIGLAYDFLLGEQNKITPAFTFISNSFTLDQYVGGLEFSLKDILLIRAGYTYEENMNNSVESLTLHSGFSGGFSVQMPLNREERTHIGIDYSY